YVGLNRRSELVAMRAAGVSAVRFLLPSAITAFLVGVLTVAALNPAASAMNSSYERRRADLMENYLTDAPKEIWLRQADGRTQMVIHARARDFTDGVVRLKGVSLFIYQDNDRSVPEFKRRLEAREARLLPGFWRLRSEEHT